jgi:hypothetical protein
MDVLTYEAERGYIDFKPLTYSQSWSDTTKRGQNVLQADTTRVYFYVKTSTSAASPFISLTDSSSSQIEWLSGGGVRVKLGTNTLNHAGNDNVYELRLKMADTSYVTAATGKLHIIDSVVDNP